MNVTQQIKKEYWIDKFASIQPDKLFQSDLIKGDGSCSKVDAFSFPFDRDANEAFLRATGGDPHREFLLLLAVLACVFQKYGYDQTLIGSLSANAAEPGDESSMIFFLADHHVAHSYRDVVKMFTGELQEVLRYGSWKETDRNRYLAEGDIALKNGLSGVLVLHDQLHAGRALPEFQLAVAGNRSESGFSVMVRYATDTFGDNFIRRFSGHFLKTLGALLQFPDSPVTATAALLPGEESYILNIGSNTQTEYPSAATIHALFEAQCQATPDAVAVVFGNITLTYRSLNEKANRLALYIREKVASPANKLVAVMLDRNDDLIIALLAVLKAGAAYIPIDCSLPRQRKNLILNDLIPFLVITTSDMLSELDLQTVKFVAMDIEKDLLPECTKGLDDGHSSSDLAYILHTSGSTGEPKGVMVEHKSVVRLVKDTNYFSFPRQMRLLMTGAISFDATVFEIWGTLLNGGTLHLLPQQDLLDASVLKRYIHHHAINTLWFTSSWFNQLVEIDLSLFDPLETLIVGGDRLSPKHIGRVKTHFPDLQIVNGYGPTENTTFSICHKVVDEDLSGDIPLGVPISNSSVYILTSALNMCPVGIPGEICVGGDGLSRGYANKPSLTREKFIDHPFIPGHKLYRTGDRGMLNEKGQVVFLGRLDFQLKVRGFRVEPGEIERALSDIGGVKEAVVTGHRDELTDRISLVAYFTAQDDVTPDKIKSHLSEVLPDYMVPSHYICLETFPLTTNGKIDRQSLPCPSEVMQLLPDEHATITDPKLETMIETWKTVLGSKKISPASNFFDAGGDSLKAIKLIWSVNSKFSCNLQIADLFKYPTPRALAELLKKDDPSHSVKHYLNDGLAQIESINAELSFQSASLANVLDIYPMTAIELGMIYSSLFHPDQPVYYDQITMTLEVNDFARLQSGIADLVKRHPIFRSAYYISEYKRPVKFVLKEIDLPLEHHDFSGVPDGEQHTLIRETLRKDLLHRHDFNGCLLWRMKFYRTASNKYFVIWNFHHAMLDGWSQNQFYSELSQLLSHGYSALPVLKHTYKDYCAISLGKKGNARIAEFWRKYLEGYTRCKLPFNYSGKRKRSGFGMIRISRTINPEIAERLEQASQRHSFSVKALCLAAHLHLMHIICNEKDVVTGIVTHERPPLEDGDKILGCFLNTIPIRMDFSNIPDGVTLATGVQKYLNEVKEYEVHLTEIARSIGEKSSSSNPIFDTIFNYTEFHNIQEWKENDVLALEDLRDDSKFKDLRGTTMTNTFYDLEVDKTHALTASIKYSPSYFDREDIEYGLDMYEKILDHLASSIKAPLSSYQLLSGQDQHKLIHEFNNTITPYSSHLLLHQLFERQAGLHPDSPAVIQDDRVLTYQELNIRSNQLAHYLLSMDVSQGDAVGLLCARNVQMMVGLLAVLKAGCSYVPVEPDYPVERREYILKNSGVKMVLSDQALPETFDGAFRSVSLTQDYSTYSDKNPEVVTGSRDLAYTIYTSGSTGQPKGVMIEHHAAVNLVEWVNHTFHVGRADRLLFVTSVCFDLSVYDIFGVLSAGGAIVIARAEQVQDPVILWDLLKRYKITFWDSVPTTMNYLITELEQSATQEIQSEMRMVFLSGDWIPSNLPDRLKKFFPQTAVTSLGGATEGTVWSNFYPIETSTSEWVSIPYGRPIQNNFFYILDEHGRMVPRGVAGELYIGGVGVARGYAGDTEKTALSFKPDPFHQELGGMMYRTGDLGRMLPDWNMEFLGRKDHQVKIRGFRVELGEIENILIKHPSIKEAVVDAREDGRGQKFLCAYVVIHGNVNGDVQQLKEFLRGELPAYMVPSYFTILEKIPLTANGKVNRKALITPINEARASRPYQAPAPGLEQQIADLWSEILSIPDIGATDDVLALGAHSLHIGSFVNRLQKISGKRIGIGDVFNQPTVCGLSDFVRGQAEVQFMAIEPVGEQDSYRISHAQKRLWVLQQLFKSSTAYNMPVVYHLEGLLDRHALQTAFRMLINRHESLRTIFIERKGQVLQRILGIDEVPSDLQYHDLSKNDDHGVETILSQKLSAAFNLDKGPLFEGVLIKRSSNHHIFLLNIHHIVSDGWSMAVMLKELVSLYNSVRQGIAHDLKALRIQYKDYSEWQHRETSGPGFVLHRKYWMDKYSGKIPTLHLPLDFQRPAERTFTGKAIQFTFDRSLSARINAYGQERGASLFMTLLTTVQALLSRWSGQSDFIIGTPVSGREHEDLYDQIGFYVNTLALHSRIEETDTFEQMLSRTKNETLNGYDHQMYPFDSLIEDLGLTWDKNRSPLFDVMLVLQNTDLPESSIGEMDGVQVRPFGKELTISKFDMVFNFKEISGEIHLLLEFNTSLFKETSILIMLELYRKLVVALLDGHSQFKDINVEPDAERQIKQSEIDVNFTF